MEIIKVMLFSFEESSLSSLHKTGSFIDTCLKDGSLKGFMPSQESKED